jgi:signal transduction histidine kinase
VEVFFLKSMLSFKPTWPFLWIILVLSMLLLICGSSINNPLAKYSLAKFLALNLALIVFTLLVANTSLKSNLVLMLIALAFTAFNFAQILEPISFWVLFLPHISFVTSTTWIAARTCLAWAVFCGLYYDRLLEEEYFASPQLLRRYIFAFLLLPIILSLVASRGAFQPIQVGITRPLEIIPMLVEYIFVLFTVSICFEAFSAYRNFQFCIGYLEKQDFIIDNLGLGLLAVDQQNRIISLNQYLAKRLEINPAEVRHRDISQLSGGALKELLGKANPSSNPSWSGKVSLTVPSGKTIEFQMQTRLISGPSKEKSGAIMIFRDLADVRQQEMGQISLRLVTESFLSGIILVDSQEKVFLINRAAKKLLNVQESPEMSLADNEDNAGNPIFRNLISHLRESLFQGKSHTLKEIEIENTDPKKTLAFESYPLRSSSGEILGAACLFRDVTQERLYEKYLEKAEQMLALGEIAAGVAHEIRNPLTSVRGFLQLVKNKNPDNPEIAEYMDIAMEEIDRANDIITEFLKFARPQKPRLSQENINTIIAEVIKIIIPGFHYKNIQVKHIKEDVPLLTLDRDQWKQVFINLFQNSLQALRAGGSLFVQTSFDPGSQKARIIIADTGCGMSREVLDKVFTPFYTTKETGTGLGLSIVYRIVKNHGGDIEIESEPGKGTTFTISLPLTG